MSLYTRTLARPMPPLPEGALPPGPAVYLDIESTGLSPETAQITLVGLAWADGQERRLEQFYADTTEDEAEVLQNTAQRLRTFAGTVTYNGTTFDLPFLRRRAQMLGVKWPRTTTYDLLQVARAWNQTYREMPNCRLQTVMAHFRLGRMDTTSGMEMVEAYRRWLKAGNPADRNLILEHNADDLLLLPDLVPLLTNPPGYGQVAAARSSS